MRNQYGVAFLQQDFDSVLVLPDLTITHGVTLVRGNLEGDITQLSSLIYRSGLTIIPQEGKKIISTIVLSFRAVSFRCSFFRSLGYNPRLHAPGFFR
jgi:hypothetical protein